MEESQRSYTREDGTLVIDIRAEPLCGESSDGEIVVCAAREDPPRYDPPEPQQDKHFKPEVRLGDNAKADLRATPGRDGAVQAMVTLTLEF